MTSDCVSVERVSHTFTKVLVFGVSLSRAALAQSKVT